MEQTQFCKQQKQQFHFNGVPYDYYTEKEAQVQINQLIQQSYWITYRMGFSPIQKISDCTKTYKSDSGWGCMLRAGQNIVSEGLKRYFKSNNIKFSDYELLQNFFDFEEKRFSIHKICSIALNQYQMSPGEWYPPNRIASILQQIQHENPMENTIKFQILSLNSDVPIIYEDIIKQISKFNSSQNSNENKSGLCRNKEHIKDNLICPICHEDNNNILLIINSRVGLEGISQEYQEIILKITQFSLFAGIIGGNMGSAHYFLGSLGSNLIYLDPHFTQDVVNSEKDADINSYYGKSAKYLPVKYLNQSLGIGFFIKNCEDFKLFHKFICDLNSQYKDFFWFFEDEEQDYMKPGHQITEIENEEDDEDGFIILK